MCKYNIYKTSLRDSRLYNFKSVLAGLWL